MILRIIRITATVFAMLAIAGCNNDIFIDGPEMPQDSFATVDGDGGEAEFYISSKDLERFSIDNFSNNAGFTYYNGSGEIISPQSPAHEVACIAYTDLYVMYKVERNGTSLKFHSIENCSGSEYSLTIRLEYSYTTCFINITVEKGADLELKSVDFGNTIELDENYKTEIRSITYRNNGPIPQTYEFRPLLSAIVYAVAEPSETWARFLYAPVRFPEYKNGTWIIGEETSVLLGGGWQYNADGWNTIVPVNVPAKNSATVSATIYFTKARTDEVAVFCNPISQREHATVIWAEVIEPVSYDITILNEDL